MISAFFHIRRCGCYCVIFVLIPIAIAMLAEIILGIWFMNQRQGLLPTHVAIGDTTALTTKLIENCNPYTRIGRYEVIERVPHDKNSFTQGLVMIADTDNMDVTINDDTDSQIDDSTFNRKIIHRLYEGTGMYGSSQLRRIDIHTGKVLAFHSLHKSYFGEGISHYRDKDGQLHIVQLTWKRKRAFEYIFNNKKSVDRVHKSQNNQDLLADHIVTWRYQTSTNEGWGITHSPSDNEFYVSDGSEFIHVWNAETRKEIRRFAVTYQHHNSKMNQPSPITMINELEYDPATNTILANVWREDIILRIDPKTGFVVTMYDMQNLLPKRDRTWRTDVLNGIALTYDAIIHDNNGDNSKLEGRNEVWVTGKYWPFMFRIRLMDSF